MKKKRWQFIALCIAIMQISAQTLKLPSPSDLFIQATDRLVIEPSWTIPTFLDMNVQEFEKSWSLLIKIMTEEPQRLIASYEKTYSERKNRALLLGQCHVYHILLINLFVLKDNRLMFSLVRPLPAGCIPIFDYAKQRNIKSFYDFYAFYFDRISADYIESVNNAFINSDSTDFYKYQQGASKLLSELYEVYEQLQDSEYEARYGALLKTYLDIFQMLLAYKHSLDEA